MKRKEWIQTGMAVLAAGILLTACEKEIDIELKPSRPQLIVEGYINNLVPEYNYVVLSRSQDFFAPDFQSVPVRGAKVTITAGELQPGGTIAWDVANRTTMGEANLPNVPVNFRNGVYFDPRLITSPGQSLLGQPGKYYLLEIEAEGKQYSAVTHLLPPLPVDSVTSGFPFTDDDGLAKVRITNHYKDPDTLGNRQMYYWRFRDNRNNFGWGGLNRSRAPGRDDLVNGEYIRLTHPQGFTAGDTVNYFMASVTVDIWNFWDSFNKVRDNDGPFSTPVSLGSTIRGADVLGCFSGLSLSSKTVVVR
jgi:Domain of unknown function (DUF4249)